MRIELVAQFAFRVMYPFLFLAHFTRSISAIPRPGQRFMTEQSNVIDPRGTAKDTDVDLGYLSIAIS